MNFQDIFNDDVANDHVNSLSQSIGADSQQTQSALSQVVPLLVSALARNTRSDEGAQSLGNALDRDHDGSVLNNISSLLDNPDSGQGNGILNHVLGPKRAFAEQEIAKSNGISLASAGKLLMIAAPIILGLLGSKKKQEGMDAGLLASLLNGFSQNHQNDGQSASAGGGLVDMIGGMLGGGGNNAQTPSQPATPNSGGGLGGFISNILDRDNDGSALDDVAGMIGGMLGGKK